MYLAEIRIGFEHSLYTFAEPDTETLISEVKLIKDGNRQTEQTFVVGFIIDNPDGATRRATPQSEDPVNYDYRLGSSGDLHQMLFPAQEESVSFNLFINSDNTPEGVEGFKASAAPVPGFPSFRRASEAHFTAEIQIIDAGKLLRN